MAKFVQLEVYQNSNWKLTLDGVTREGCNEKMTLSPQTILRSRHYYPIFQMSKLRLQVGQVSQVYTHNKQAVNLVGSYSHSPDALRTPAQWVGFTETRGHVLEPVPSFLPAPTATAAGVGDVISPPSPLLPGCH